MQRDVNLVIRVKGKHAGVLYPGNKGESIQLFLKVVIIKRIRMTFSPSLQTPRMSFVSLSKSRGSVITFVN